MHTTFEEEKMQFEYPYDKTWNIFVKGLDNFR